MRVILVTMPWHALDTPSLALGVLHEKAHEANASWDVEEYFANVSWAEYLLDRTAGEINPMVYRDISENGFIDQIGEWMFSGALYDRPRWRTRGFARHLQTRGVDPGPALRIQELAPGFIEVAAAELLDMHPDVVGFTTTFMQNAPSLALAKRLKRLQPALPNIFGGGNCDGAQGPALHRNFDFLDYVVSGEGERVFPQFLAALEEGSDMSAIPGLSWRSEGRSRSNCPASAPVPVEEIPTPNYDCYFERIERSPIRHYFEPKIMMETSRGCWWGEKHHCTFCGLNGSLMKFRSKPGDVALGELEHLVRAHKCLDVIMVDNILEMKYFSDFLPGLANTEWDLRIHYEVKANLNISQVETLRAAGVAHIQPGIESLNSNVLRLMKKGVAGTQNVELLRNCEESNLTVSWNVLYGFPGESAADYESVIAQMPALVHLQPPGGAARIALERFSPNFNSAAELFGEVGPSSVYRYVYDLDESQLRDMVYLYDAPAAGIDGPTEQHLSEAIERWRDTHTGSLLTYSVDDNRDGLTISDERAGWEARELRIDGGAKTDAYLELRNHTTRSGLRKKLAQMGHEVGEDDLERWLLDWRREGIVFEDDERFTSLATRREAIPVTV